MGLLTAGIVVVVGLSAASLVLMERDRRRQHRLYREKVGLDLAGLVALLPEAQRGRRFVDFMIAPWSEGPLRVGLVYQPDDGLVRVGNPPNVGLEFDPGSGKLLAVRPDGVGLGIK